MPIPQAALPALAVAIAIVAPAAALAGAASETVALWSTSLAAVAAAIPALRRKTPSVVSLAAPAEDRRVADPALADLAARAEAAEARAASLAAALDALAEGRFPLPEAAGASAGPRAAQSAVDEATAIAELYASGDLSVAGSSAHRGAFAVLIERLNGVGDGVRGMVAAIHRALGDMARRSEALDAAAATLGARLHDQAEALGAARAAGDALGEAVAEVAAAADRGAAAAERAAQVAGRGAEMSARAIEAIDRVTEASRRIGGLLDTINGIARQTNLLGVNAAVEAARAGEAGRGFAVVSAEIRTLAAEAGDTARRIEGLVRETDAAVSECGREVSACAGALAEIGVEIDSVGDTATAIRSVCLRQSEALGAAVDRVGAADAAARESEKVADATAAAAAGLDKAAESLRRQLDGVLLEDHTMERAIRERAAEASRRFEEGVRRGSISMEALFSRDYTPMPGTDPQQFMAPFVDFTDAVLPDLLEDALALGAEIAFSAAVNVDGFLPTHNRKFSQPQGPDPVWNAAHCRNRRFFTDRVGLAAGLSTAPLLLQAYRRDMGGGRYATMKDISAPIMVQGRHWGGLRIGYRAKSVTLGASASARSAA